MNVKMDRIRCEKIAMVNDMFRLSGLGVMLAGGVQSVNDITGLLRAVRDFDKFNEDNDPWHEHDYGRLDWYGDSVIWKIDYYDQSLTYWEDPLSLKCRRIITIMLTEDY
ncbi:MAG TPA: DUF3768 domain-containing protein [bacterium]|nr:DUF3768 domain-containing protein [bacterium]